MWRPMLNCTSKKIIKIGHVVDIPCFIDADSVKKSIGFTFKKALEERNLGVLQILASLENNPDPIHGYSKGSNCGTCTSILFGGQKSASYM